MNFALKSAAAAFALAAFSFAPVGELKAEGCYHGVTLVTNFNKPKVKKTFALSVPRTPATKKKKRR